MTGRAGIHQQLARRDRRHWWRADDGQITAFVLVFMTSILALAGLTLDGGLALATAVRANCQAEAAARAGAQAIDLNQYRATGTVRLVPAEAIANAQRQLAAEGTTGTTIVSGETVTVTVTASQPTQLLKLVGIGSISVHGTGSAHPQRGMTPP
jgi:hypothetical protein